MDIGLRRHSISRQDVLGALFPQDELSVITQVCRLYPVFNRQALVNIFEYSDLSEINKTDAYLARFNHTLTDRAEEEHLKLDVLPVKVRTSVKLNMSWCSHLLARRILPSLQTSAGAVDYPIGSVVRRKGVKELQFVHIYRHDNIVVAPLYGRIWGSFMGVFLIDLRTPDCSLFLSVDKSVNQLKTVSDVGLQELSARLVNLGNEKEYGAVSKGAVIVGAMVNNFGHTVLNHCSAISVLTDQVLSKEIEKIYIGDDDFLGFSALLAGSEKIAPLSEHYEPEFGLYVIPEIVLPISTKLPVRSSLRYIIDQAKKKSHDVNDASDHGELIPAVVFALDARRGLRRCKNSLEMLVESLKILQTILPRFKLLLEGHTAKPGFGGAQITPNDAHAFDFESIKSLVTECGMGAADIIPLDGLLLSEKIQICQSLDVKLSIAPLGSSLMFPIYFVNAPTIGYGESRMAGLMKKEWAWHVEPGCHADWLFPMQIATNLHEDADGYTVDISAVRAMIVSAAEAGVPVKELRSGAMASDV